MGKPEDRGGFENVYNLVGGHGRYQWYCLAICSFQLIMATWNHMGYIFIGAVPQHWCHIKELGNSSWTADQIKNISIPKVAVKSGDDWKWKYDQCQHYNIDYKLLLEQSNGDFEKAMHITRGENVDGESSPSSVKECTAWDYDKSIYESTIVSEFDLVCGKRYLVASIQSLYMIGAFIGNGVCGPLNDKILGRRRAALLTITLVLTGGFLAAFSNSYLMFVASRFLVAIGTVGCMQATIVWLMEHCDTQSRARMHCIETMFFGVGYAILPIYAYFIRSWSNLQLAFSLTTLSLLSFYWMFPESPRWLASHGRDKEAVKGLQRMARFNKIIPQPAPEDLMECVRHCHAQNDTLSPENADSDQRKGNKCLQKISATVKNYGTLVSTAELRKISFVVWTLFSCVAFVYYGFAFSSTNLTSSPYLLVSLGALMDVPAAVLPILFLSKWGRRPTTVTCCLFAGLASLAISLTPAHHEGLRTILSMIGKLFICAAFTILYLVVGESYPTVARTTGQGVGALFGRIGSISAPYAADLLTTVYPDLPSVVFGVVALVAASVAFLLPEMKNVHMKDQVHEYQKKEQKNIHDIMDDSAEQFL